MTACPECGVDVVDGAVFCHKCGATISSPQDPSTPTAGVEDAPASAAKGSSGQRQAEPAARNPTAADRFLAATRARQSDDHDDSEVDLWEGDYSAKAMVGIWLLLGLLTIAAIVAGVLFSMSGTAWLVTAGVVVVLWLGTYLVLLYKQFSVHYRLTNQRLIHQKGLLRRVTDRIEVIDVDDITYSQGVIERLLDVGTIRVTSSDRTHPEIDLPGIENVRHVATLMDDARRQERRRRGLHIEAV